MIATNLWRLRELGKLDELQNRILELECEVNDKQYEINKLKSDNENLKTEIEKLKCILDSKEKSQKCSDVAPSREWLEDRHQSDCIEINRLNTVIEVLIDKYSSLRQQMGL